MMKNLILSAKYHLWIACLSVIWPTFFYRIQLNDVLYESFSVNKMELFFRMVLALLVAGVVFYVISNTKKFTEHRTVRIHLLLWIMLFGLISLFHYLLMTQVVMDLPIFVYRILVEVRIYQTNLAFISLSGVYLAMFMSGFSSKSKSDLDSKQFF